MASFLVQFTFFLVLARAGPGIAADECAPVRCGRSGPEIRFPFWLRGSQPETCGFPGFELTCQKNSNTMFHLQVPVRSSGAGNLKNLTVPVSVQGTVKEIDYKSQMITVTSPNSSCLPSHLSDNFTSPLTSPFEVYTYKNDFTLFNCSSNNRKENRNQGNMVRCLNGAGYDVFAFIASSRADLAQPSCFKMFDIFEVSMDLMVNNFENAYVQDLVDLHWSEPSCGHCESQGHVCKLDTKTRQTFCFVVPEQKSSKKKGISRGALATGLGISLSLLLLISVLLSGLIFLRRKKEDRKKHETLLEDYKAHRPSRFSYADIKKMTGQFREKLGQRNRGTTSYKGKLTNDGSVVAVKMLSTGESLGKLVKKMDGIQHENVARLVGYCDEGSKRALVFEFSPNGSLEIPNKTLDFKDLYHVAIGIAKGIDHLHHGCNQEVLHLSVNPRNVLLDHSYNPRLTDYGIQKSCFKEQNIIGEYISPEVISSNYGNATVKSDVYSFGILLFGMAAGKADQPGGGDQVYLPEWIYEQIDGGDEDEMKRKMMIVGLWCTQWYPWNRPSMKAVIQMLQAQEMPALPPNPFAPLV